MAIAHDADANSGDVNVPSSPQTFSHTMGTVSNGIVCVGVTLWQNVAGVGLVTGITYGGVAMTIAGTERVSGAMVSDLYFLKNPPAGSNTVSVAFSGAAGAILTFLSGAVSFSGVDQTNPNDATNGTTGFSMNATVNTTTVADNAWVVHNVSHFGTEATTIGQGSSAWNVSGLSVTGAAGYVGPKTPAGAQTTNWTWATNNRDWAISTLSLKPAAAAAASANNLSVLSAG